MVTLAPSCTPRVGDSAIENIEVKLTHLEKKKKLNEAIIPAIEPTDKDIFQRMSEPTLNNKNSNLKLRFINSLWRIWSLLCLRSPSRLQSVSVEGLRGHLPGIPASFLLR